MEGAREGEALAGSGPFMPRKALAAARAALRSARMATDECATLLARAGDCVGPIERADALNSAPRAHRPQRSAGKTSESSDERGSDRT